MEVKHHLRITAIVQYQLRHNFYPPAKWNFVAPTVLAVIACIEGTPELEINLNEAMEYTGEGKYHSTAQGMVSQFRLEQFVQDEIALVGPKTP